MQNDKRRDRDATPAALAGDAFSSRIIPLEDSPEPVSTRDVTAAELAGDALEAPVAGPQSKGIIALDGPAGGDVGALAGGASPLPDVAAKRIVPKKVPSLFFRTIRNKAPLIRPTMEFSTWHLMLLREINLAPFPHQSYCLCLCAIPTVGARVAALSISEVMTMSTAKEEPTRLIQEQPADSSPEEIVRELAIHVMVERGREDTDALRVVSNEEIVRRIRSWRE